MAVFVDEFRSIVESMHLELTEASFSLKIMAGLRAPESIDVYNRYRGFFGPTFVAHRDRFAIKVHNVAADNPRGPSLHRAWRIIDEDPEIGRSADTAKLRERLRLMSPVLDRVGRIRHKRSAHFEINAILPTVLWGELNPMLTDLQSIVNDTAMAISTSLSFNTPGGQQVQVVMERLSEQARE